MRIVADTNTILSGLLWQGPPRQIINRARAGDITLHTSLVLLAELAEVIGRSKFTRRIQSVQLSAAGLVADYQHLAVLVDPQPLAAPTSRDADDDHDLVTDPSEYFMNGRASPEMARLAPQQATRN